MRKNTEKAIRENRTYFVLTNRSCQPRNLVMRVLILAKWRTHSREILNRLGLDSDCRVKVSGLAKRRLGGLSVERD